MPASATLAALELRPLSARSLVLSLLLGSHPAQRPVRELVALVGELGVSETTLRVALSRLVAAGDLEREEGSYRLSPRLLERQRRQDAALTPQTHDDAGHWAMVVVTTQGRDPARRQELRRELSGQRLAELREGHWLRPDNLTLELSDQLRSETTRFRAVPDGDPGELLHRLWDLDAWRDRGHLLLDHFESDAEPLTRITVAAAIVRHLFADPILPAHLTPADWPAQALRAGYADYRARAYGQWMP
ncbi:PaaX domain-containing protein, C- domain protein [Nocardioides dubius]|uniref:PaaX family transcriptional regulator C-terminal domain-containing protein n=1 Tax=Nocardioides dubius TaxID=317019 RepID=A0ABN1TS32_9ACTN